MVSNLRRKGVMDLGLHKTEGELECVLCGGSGDVCGDTWEAEMEDGPSKTACRG